MADKNSLRVYEAADPMPADYRKLVLHLLWIGADVETTLLFKETDYLKKIIDLAPTPLDRLQISHLYAQELEHGYIFYQLLKELGVEPTAEDFKGGRRVYFGEVALDTWTDVALMNCLSDRVGLYQYRQLKDCTYRPLARVVGKIEQDEIGHAYLGYTSLKKICKSEAGRAEAQGLLAKWFPTALDMLGRSSSSREQEYIDRGIKKYRNQELRQEWLKEVMPLLEGLGLMVPDPLANRRFL